MSCYFLEFVISADSSKYYQNSQETLSLAFTAIENLKFNNINIASQFT